MPQRITARRFARSALTPEGPTADGAGGQTNVLDFSLGAREGLEIVAVTGLVGNIVDTSIAANDNALAASSQSRQSLHLEDGQLEDAGNGQTAEDVDNVDSEIIFEQLISPIWIHTGVAAEGQGLSVVVTPTGRVDLTDRAGNGVFTARNISHRAETETNSADVYLALLIEYYRVELSLAELGFFLARRS